MKKPTTCFKMIAILALFLIARIGHAQCTAAFIYSVGANGNVNFYSTSTPVFTASPTYCYWIFGNSTTSLVAAPANTATTTYPTNGSYVVTMYYYSLGQCTVSTTQTIVVSTVTTPSCNLNASFVVNNYGNGIYNFYNTTTGTVSGASFNWDFGDGSSSTTNPSVAHTYTANGLYTVILTANNNSSPACADADTVVVNVNSVCNFSVAFNYTMGTNGQVALQGSSAGATGTVNYTWNFWGSGTASGATTTHTFPANGVYTVSLIGASSTCSASAIQTISINNVTATPCSLNASFYYGGGATSGAINFHSTTTGTTSGTTYAWAFGDGTTGTGAAPPHTYAGNGVYTVTMTASNSSTCNSSYVLTVYVTSYCNLLAGIGYSLNANGNVSFYNTSTGTSSITSYYWIFGDGSSSTSQNPSHNYANGTYYVYLSVTNSTASPACQDTAGIVITVTSNTCVANVTFSLIPSGAPHGWYAVVSSSVGVAGASWYWGDSTSTSSGLYTSHTYSAAGNYYICLTVTMTCGTVGTYCNPQYVSRSANDNSMIVVNTVSPNQLVTGIKNNSAEKAAFVVSPNPAAGQFNIRMNGLTSNKATVAVYNLVGSLVYETDSEISNGTLTKDIQLNEAANGVYFIKVNADNNTYTQKVIISK